ncbi:TIGR03546 family protein [Candidatus Laterigemmans baculatus]|uniref:TIGR03546 family protein n=1 Tax=Candidatus Laterigemmans baculatus TaxID=2770505 RepID=UPI0013DBC304|nr:TIGR03546 family protein [Candidatus Laterigemmans baculatus]
MILWIIKQLLSLRQAVLGRARPSELAWGLAIGVGIGLIPKGNLVSVLLISSLVTLRVNHGVAALAAVACSFLAARFDPWTHELGVMVLGAEQVRPFMERIWNWPLMPWTDLNNTVVMGSTVLAGASLLPTYAISLPLFQWLATRTATREVRFEPVPLPSAGSETKPAPTASPSPDRGLRPSLSSDTTDREAVLAKLIDAQPAGGNSEQAAEEEWADPLADGLEAGEAQRTEAQRTEAQRTEAQRIETPHIETQIDVIRLRPALDENVASTGGGEPVSGGQMNEALGYLLRRLRDSRQGKAA